MPEVAAQNSSPQDGNASGEATSGTADEFNPITSQEDLNRIVADRVNRERAKFADYRDLKAKAERLSEIEAANLSESERATRRIAELEAELSKSQSAATRRSVALAKGLPAELVDRLQGDTQEEIEADADELLAVFNARSAPITPGTPRPDPSQGARTGQPLNSDGLEQALRSKLGIR